MPMSQVLGYRSTEPCTVFISVCAGDPNSAPDGCTVGTFLATVLPPLISLLWHGSWWLLNDYLGKCQIRWLACSPFTQENELEDGRFQISAGNLRKPCHVCTCSYKWWKGIMIWKEIREGYAGGLGGRRGQKVCIYIITSIKRPRLKYHSLARWFFVLPFGDWRILFSFPKLTTLKRKQHNTVRKVP